METRLDEAADRNWEISEAQERTTSFLEAQGDVIVRRDADGAHHLRQRRLSARLPAAAAKTWLATALRLPVLEQGETTRHGRRHAHL